MRPKAAIRAHHRHSRAHRDGERITVGMRCLSPGVFNRSAALRCDIRARLRSSRSAWACSPACWTRSAQRSFCWTSEASDRAEARSPLCLGVWGVLVTIFVDADSQQARIDVGAVANGGCAWVRANRRRPAPCPAARPEIRCPLRPRELHRLLRRPRIRRWLATYGPPAFVHFLQTRNLFRSASG